MKSLNGVEENKLHVNAQIRTPTSLSSSRQHSHYNDWATQYNYEFRFCL